MCKTDFDGFPSFIEQIDRPEEMPVWEDCAWRRERCGLNSCKFCKRMNIAENRLKSSEVEELFSYQEPPAIEGFDLSASRRFENFNSTKLFSGEMPPDPHLHPLFKDVERWHHNLMHLFEKTKAAWTTSELGRDLVWYGNLLPVKTARLLDDRFQLDETEEPVELDYQYTRYALAQCLLKIYNAMTLMTYFEPQMPDFSSLNKKLCLLAARIMEI